NHEWYCDTIFSRKRRSERTVAPNYFYSASGALDLAHIRRNACNITKDIFSISFDTYLYLPTYLPVHSAISKFAPQHPQSGIEMPSHGPLVRGIHTCFVQACQHLNWAKKGTLCLNRCVLRQYRAKKER